MLHESKFSTWIRSGGQSTFVLALNSFVDLETKFSVVPDRLLDGIIDDALAAAVGSLNRSLPSGASIDISESPRVCWRGLCSNVTQLFDLRSSFHRMPPLLLGAGHSRWHCAAVLSCTS